jgi:hypothetical protein
MTGVVERAGVVLADAAALAPCKEEVAARVTMAGAAVITVGRARLTNRRGRSCSGAADEVVTGDRVLVACAAASPGEEAVAPVQPRKLLPEIVYAPPVPKVPEALFGF